MSFNSVGAYGNNPLACCAPCIGCCCAPVVGALYFITVSKVYGASFMAVLAWTVVAVVLVYVVVMMIKSILAVEVHSAERSAAILYNYNHGTTEGLPRHLQGVFWMSTNAAPELLASLDGAYWHEEKQMLNFDAGATYNWTYSNNAVGWMYWLALRLSYLFCAEMKMYFNEDLTEASMPLYICGFCHDHEECDGIWLPTGMIWKMKQDPDDENTWDREIYLYCNPNKVWDFGSYRLIRIIDENGWKLPGYADMVEQMEMGISDGEDAKEKAIFSKPDQQIMNGDDCFGNVFFGEEGDPEEHLLVPLRTF